ncbi:MAG: CHASE domain-containing protein [Pelomonas sp.]|nr:CHASE domain-containing protein [Roseateles sp.]
MRLQRKHSRYLVRAVTLTLSYLVVGLAGLQLAGDPLWVTVLFPAAGVALAAMLAMGRRFAPAVALGSYLMNRLVLDGDHLPQPDVAAVGIAIGATLQAVVGATLVERRVTRPLTLAEPRDLLLFAGLGAALACLVSATIGVTSLWLSGRVAGFAAALPAWLSWWLGDTVGVLIAAPIALTLIGRPRRVWRPRGLSVGLPLLLGCLLLGGATYVVTRWDRQRNQDDFEQDALTAVSNVRVRAAESLLALQAARSMLLVAPELTRADFELGTARYLAGDGTLLALGVAWRVAPARLARFEADAQAEGLADYRVHDRAGPGSEAQPAGADRVAIRLIEPLARNRAALGVNIPSVARAGAALDGAVASGEPGATPAFRLSQAVGGETGVVVYQALYAGRPETPEERRAAFRGTVFATLRPDAMLAPARHGLPAYLSLCLVDLTSTPIERLAGPPGCEQPGGRPTVQRSLDFGGREWALRVIAPHGLPTQGNVSLPFAVMGTVAVGLLGMLLLMISGRAQRIEDLVRARTLQLQREIAEREEASEALGASEQRLRNIFESAPIGIVFASLDGIMEDVNPTFCQMLGRSAEEIKGLHVREITVEADRGNLLEPVARIVAGQISTYVGERRLMRGDGSTLHVRISVKLMPGDATRPARIVAAVQNLEDELRVAELERARQAAEAASQAKTEFLSRMSHELRTPLNAMLGFTQLLEMDAAEPLSARQRNRAEQIQLAGWHLLEMINDVLDLSRIEAGSMRLAPAPLDLATLVEEARALVEGDAAARGLQIRVELEAQARRAWGDPTRVKQILTNLLSNAVKYNVAGGTITLSARAAAPDWVVVGVADTGLGMTAEQLANLFQPFNRLGREHGGPSGTGIGLVISRRLAELMGGSLTVSSSAGIGSVFSLRLPSGPAREAPRDAGADTVLPPIEGPRRVVYIEDNPTNAEVMRGMFEQRPQLTLEIHASGLAGLEAVLAAPPDLVLLDLQLPDADGVELLRRLRLRWSDAELPVVCVSANALSEQIDACEALGIRAYLTKPVALRELLGVLDRVLA